MQRNSTERRLSGLTVVSPDVKKYYDHQPLIAAIDHHNRQRPSYFEADRRAWYMAGYIRSEVGEVVEELERYGTSDFSEQDTEAESTDVFVILASLASSTGTSIDQQSIWPSVNGQGTHSDIFDRMKEVSGDITQENLEAPLHQLFILLASAINHAPISVDLHRTLHTKVLPKNRRNHHQMYYSGTDVLAGGAPLSPEEMIAQHDHSYKALRLFRKAFAGPAGLPVHEHLPYADLIHDFRHSAFSLEMIKRIIELEQKQRQSAIT